LADYSFWNLKIKKRSLKLLVGINL